MFSQTNEYALRVVVFLAKQARAGTPATTRQIAAATHVPEGYLSKIMQALGRARIVKAQRGLYGGFTLARPPESVSVLDVIRIFDPIPRIRTCPLGLKSHGVRLCALHRRLDAAFANAEKAFAESSLADLLADEESSVPLCE